MLYGICSDDFVQDIEGMVEVSTQYDLFLLLGDLLMVACIKCYTKQLDKYGPSLSRTD